MTRTQPSPATAFVESSRADGSTFDDGKRHKGASRLRGRGIGAMVARRALFVLPVLGVVSVALFVAAALSPFDPLAGYLQDRYLTTSDADKALIAREMGFDASWHQAYREWLGAALSGDFGFSRSFNQPVGTVIAERLPWTLLLVGVGLGAAILAALAIGVWTGMRRGGFVDRVVAGLCVAIQGLPPFVLALAAISLFALGLGWLPVAGLTDAGADPTFNQVARHLVLPASVLALSQLPWLLLAVRESVSTNRSEDFVAGAVARGVDERTIVRRHILPTSLAPFVTLVGARLPELVVGAVLVEEIFSWPGIAGALVTAASNLDMALLTALTLGTTLVVLLGSLFADVVYVVLDPRVRADG